ncbi:uncharacterized protein F4807DRAFT_191270 [Annulohypoxylon truncatum]|uniref:uncharacterized protein n=1 Tax=Annulohypoxylon truncatum TaxID=327061 RepID=UPI002008E554|nr:uncharacterized protein F4807DRAFT_191270 [Annulohypoxylon truncatum]KAI1207219.1 hypothetical protein F4807DRAFT_191270 [Annulohypoxylon truncatum]
MDVDEVAVDASWREDPSPGNEAQEKYQCSRCPSSFKRPEHLKRHQRSHDGHKPFMCSICLKRFFRSDILTRHELMHLAAQRTNHTVSRKRACTECARARERCSRDEPCLRCSTKSLQCQYPDDAGQKTNAFGSEPQGSTRNEHGQFEDHLQLAPQHPSILPKQEGFMSSSNPLHRLSFHEDDAPLRDFIHTLRSPTATTPSYPLDPYRSNAFNPDGPGLLLNGIGGEPSSFAQPKPLTADQRVPLFDPATGSPYTLPRLHNALGDYHTNPSTDPSFDFSPEAMSSTSSSHPHPRPQDPFPSLPTNASQSGNLGSPNDLETSAQQPRGLLTLADFGSRPINLKAYELIASHFKELRLERGGGGGGDAGQPAASNNISESQRTAQHELFVKLYYERFERQAY